MSESRKKFDQEFKASAVRIVQESGKPIAQIARDLGVHEGTLGNWVAKARAAADPGGLRPDEREELKQLRAQGRDIADRGVMSSSDPWSSGRGRRRNDGGSFHRLIRGPASVCHTPRAAAFSGCLCRGSTNGRLVPARARSRSLRPAARRWMTRSL